MPVAEIVGLAVEDLLNFFRQRVNESARRKTNVDLIFPFFGNTADLKRLPLFVRLRKKCKRSARLGQTKGMKIALVVGNKLLDPRRSHLRDHVADFLIVGAGVQRFHDVPVVAFFL